MESQGQRTLESRAKAGKAKLPAGFVVMPKTVQFLAPHGGVTGRSPIGVAAHRPDEPDHLRSRSSVADTVESAE
jgi:hypothetical protein